MKKNTLILISCLIFLFCCHHKLQNVDGGPCNYSINHFQAEVISIDSLSPYEFNLTFICPDYKVEKDKDTFSYYNLYHSYLTPSVIREKRIHPGQKIPFHVDIIESGSCNPLVTQLMIDSI